MRCQRKPSPPRHLQGSSLTQSVRDPYTLGPGSTGADSDLSAAQEESVTDDAEALRVTSDSLLSDLAELESLEQEKRTVEATDPRLVDLAGQIERLARRLLGEAVGQRRLSEDTHADAAAGGSSAPIAETHRDMRLILADWRDAERRLSESREGSHEAAGAASDVERHRIEYQAAFSDARRRGE